MTRIIIAPTDFSTASLNAVNYAAALAVAIDAELLLINIVPMPVSAVSEVSTTAQVLDEMEEDSENMLSKIKDKLLLQTKAKIDIHYFSKFGTVEYELEKICKLKNPFALVMSVSANAKFKRFFFGSAMLSAVKFIPYPVLVIPEKYSFKKVRKVAVASDLEMNIDYKIKSVIVEWVSFFQASLDIIHVTEKSDINGNDASVSIGFQNILAKYHPTFHLITKAKIENGINEYIRKNEPDILIMLPKDRSAFEEIFHRSHSRPFLLHSHIPILAIPESL
jgi:nucleotide-binding universal stress UspA family protein